MLSLISYTGICQNSNIEYLSSITWMVESRSGYGTGNSIVKSNGDVFILTAAHVVYSSYKTNSESEGVTINIPILKEEKQIGIIKYNADIIRFDEINDIALLKVQVSGFATNSIKFIEDDKQVKVGMKICHMGNFYGPDCFMSYTEGVLSSKTRRVDKLLFYQTNCQISPGSSGGGLFFDDKYLGMVIYKRDNISLFIPVSRIRQWAKEQKCEFIFSNSCDYSK